MNLAKKHLFARGSRDRLIDLLGFGETYPVRDLPVDADPLMVPQGDSASIPIEATQRECIYDLYNRESEAAVMREEDGATVPASVTGTGETALLESPMLANNKSFRIRATKKGSKRWVYLRELADIRVGLDTQLAARVISGVSLDPQVDNPADAAPRLIEHGAEVFVEVDRSQSGVDYCLVSLSGAAQEVISEGDVRGNLRTITLRSRPITEDTVIRVRAQRMVVMEGQEEPPKSLLDIALPVQVRFNAELPVSVDGSYKIEHRAGATVAITGSQIGVQYQLYARPIGPRDFLWSGALGVESVEVAGEGGRALTIKRPAHSSAWTDPQGFQALGAPAAGTGGVLHLPTGLLGDDCMILVRAQKNYPLGDGRQVSIVGPLKQVAVVLMRPDPGPLLRLRVLMAGATTNGALQLWGGQQGVFYAMSASAGGADLGRPAYIHEREGSNPASNLGVQSQVVGVNLVVGRDQWTDLMTPELRGIEEVAVEVDLAISYRPEGFVLVSAAERATRLPELPIVDTGPLSPGATLHGRAIKARTGLSSPLVHTAVIASVPAIYVQAAENGGSETGVIVEASRADEAYLLLVNGSAHGSVQSGDGQDLSFTIAALAKGATVEVVVIRGQEPGIVVEQVVSLAAPVVSPAASG